MNLPGGFPEITIDENSAIPKYIQLANALELLIRQGHIPPDSKLPSENDFFDSLNISRSTIRNALAILERQNLVIRRQGNGTFSSSILPAKSESSSAAIKKPVTAMTIPSRQRVIGLIVPSMKNAIYPEIVRGVEDCANTHGYTVFIGNTYTDQMREKILIEQMLHSGIDGLIIDPSHSMVEHQEFPSYPILTECSVPVVLINNYIPGIKIPVVSPDDKQCGKLAADYFYSHGHRQIAMVYKACAAAAVNRRDGFVERLRQLGVTVDAEKIIAYPEERDGDEPGFRQTIKLLGMPNPPSAIFYFNDDIAIKGILAIRESGLVVGRDVSIIGFDNIAESSDGDIRLTTFEHPKKYCGKWAADMLFARINQGSAPQSVLIQPNFIIRESVSNISR